MAYCTVEDIKNFLPEEQIIQLTDDNDTGMIDIEKLNDCIRRADNFIDGHIRGRYDVPLVTVPEMVRDISIKLSTWFLFNRSLLLTVPESLKEMYGTAVKLLQQIQQGKVNPFPVSDEPTFFGTNKLAGQASSVMNDVTNNWAAYNV